MSYTCLPPLEPYAVAHLHMFSRLELQAIAHLQMLSRLELYLVGDSSSARVLPA